MMGKPMYVYLVEAIGADIIKIGVTTDISRRVSDLQSCFPYHLKLLTSIPGGFDVEMKLHRLFHEHRLRSEWFNAGPVREWVVAGCVVPDEIPSGGRLVRSIMIRVTPDMSQRVRAQAKSEGLTFSEWARNTLNAWAGYVPSRPMTVASSLSLSSSLIDDLSLSLDPSSSSSSIEGDELASLLDGMDFGEGG